MRINEIKTGPCIVVPVDPLSGMLVPQEACWTEMRYNKFNRKSKIQVFLVFLEHVVQYNNDNTIVT